MIFFHSFYFKLIINSLFLDVDSVFDKYDDNNSNEEAETRDKSHTFTSGCESLQNKNNELRSKNKRAFSKSYLRVIYEWLKGLYSIQTRASLISKLNIQSASKTVGTTLLTAQQKPNTQSNILPR
jgi:hypothetical protein